MKGLKNVLVMVAMLLALLGAGTGVLAVRAENDREKVSTYNRYIASARERASKGIYYYAKQDYLSAFSIYSDDRLMFQEFLDFLRDSEDESYVSYLKIYRDRYPQEAKPYEILCRIYEEEGRYKDIQTLLLTAAAAGASSPVLAEYYDRTLYMFQPLGGGYENISPFYGNQAIIEQNGKKGLYYYGSGVTIPAEYDEISYYINGAVATRRDGECYFMDLRGNKSGVLSREVDSLSMLSNGFAAVSSGGGYSYVDNTLQVPDSLPYEYATTFSEGVAAVKSGGKWGIIDLQAQYIVEPIYEDIALTEFGTCVSGGVIFARQNNGYVMLNAQGKRMNDYLFEEVCTFALSGQPAAVKMAGEWTFVGTDGALHPVEVKLAGAKSYDNYLAPVTLDGNSWGYMDMQGNIVIEPQFDDCRQFSAYGVAPVKNGELWSMIQLLRYRNNS